MLLAFSHFITIYVFAICLMSLFLEGPPSMSVGTTSALLATPYTVYPAQALAPTPGLLINYGMTEGTNDWFTSSRRPSL